MALQKVKVALQALQDALPGVPMGTPIHTKLVSVIKQISQEVEKVQSDPALQIQTLLHMARQAGQQSPIAALQRMYPNNAPPALPQAHAGIPPMPAAAPGAPPMPMMQRAA